MTSCNTPTGVPALREIPSSERFAMRTSALPACTLVQVGTTKVLRGKCLLLDSGYMRKVLEEFPKPCPETITLEYEFGGKNVAQGSLAKHRSEGLSLHFLEV